MELRITFPGESTVKSIELSDTVFAQPYNEALIHQVFTAFMAGGRAGTKAQKTRSEVSGGGKKPWRQKGTGRARAGTTRSPLWRKGGTTFAAVPRDFKQKVNRKMYEGAMRSIWSELVRTDRVVVLDTFVLEQPKTKEFLKKMKELNVEKALIVHDNIDRNILLAARNLYEIQLCSPDAVNPAALLAFDHVLITAAAIKEIEERLQ